MRSLQVIVTAFDEDLAQKPTIQFPQQGCFHYSAGARQVHQQSSVQRLLISSERLLLSAILLNSLDHNCIGSLTADQIDAKLHVSICHWKVFSQARIGITSSIRHALSSSPPSSSTLPRQPPGPSTSSGVSHSRLRWLHGSSRPTCLQQTP